MVECDVCGGNYNRSYLVSHKRLAHSRGNSAAPAVSEAEAVEAIVGIYKRLSRETKKLVVDRLSAALR